MSSSHQGASRQMRPLGGGGPSSSSAQNHKDAAVSTAATTSPSFTGKMRDRQSRGKDPYTKERRSRVDDDDDDDDEMDIDDDDDDDDEMDDEGGTGMAIGTVPKNEDFEERERKQFALSVLDNPEQLMMYAQSTNDSIPGQRYRFMSVLCGFEEKTTSTTTAMMTETPRQQQQAGRVRRR